MIITAVANSPRRPSSPSGREQPSFFISFQEADKIKCGGCGGRYENSLSSHKATDIATFGNYVWHWLALRLIIATVECNFHILTKTFSYPREIILRELSSVANISVYFVFYSVIKGESCHSLSFRYAWEAADIVFPQRSQRCSSHRTVRLEPLQCLALGHFSSLHASCHGGLNLF